MINQLLRITIILFLILIITYSLKKNYKISKKIQNILKNRLYLSFPIGTIILVLINLIIYLLVQRGFWHFNNPLWIPFVTSGPSNFLGTLLGSWTHIGPSHLYSNLLGTIIFAPVAEILFNTKKTNSKLFEALKRIKFPFFISKLFEKPKYRATFFFPLIWFLIGVFISLSSPSGIGFSGIYFAIIGFILILEPILVIYLFLVQILINSSLNAFFEPITVTSATLETTQPVWANLGVWAHVMGFLLGITLGILLFLERKEIQINKPEPSHVLFATLIIGFTKGLDWLFKLENQGEYVMFSAFGFIFLITIAFILSEFWDKYQNKYSRKISYLGKKTNGIRILKSIVRDYRSYLILLTFIILFMSSFMITAKYKNQPTKIANTSVEIKNYEIWYEEETGLLIFNEEKNIFSLLIKEEELQNQRNESFYIGGLMNYQKFTIKNTVFEATNKEMIRNTEVSYRNKTTSLFNSSKKETGLKVDGNNLMMNFLKNNSIEIMINQTKNNKEIIEIGSNKTKNLNKQIKLFFEGEKLFLSKSDEFETIIGKINP